jgi:bisphosphoglycerate-independent phosphoglycerate mutase (AlkP superfamily)
MEYKYYTAVCFDTLNEAAAFSQRCLTPFTEEDTATQYMYPVALTETGKYAVVVYNLNDLNENDILQVSIQKVNTEFIPLD